MTALALQQAGDPPSRLFEIIHRVADRMEPATRAAFLRAVERTEIDESALRSALRRQDISGVVQALGISSMARRLQIGVEQGLRRTVIGTGEAVAAEFADELAIDFAFDVTNPNAVMAARQQTATLVKQVGDETRLGIRRITADMFTEGVPPRKAAREIRTIVGLRESHARAVLNFRRQIEEGNLAAVDRRLDAATKQRIRSAIRRGEVSESFIDDVAETYRKSLLNRRSLDIARTESMRAAHLGQQETWRQAVSEGHLDTDRTRRVVIVTPDDRLRESHAAVPGMNPDGVGLEEPFDTPFGRLMYPPWEPNCRCSVALTFEGGAGML